MTDDAAGTPGRKTLHDRLDRLRALRGPVTGGFAERVGDLVVIASSSRGGSSMLTELLRMSRHALHFRAEINPFLRLAGLGYPDSGTGSDRLGADDLARLGPGVRRALDEELALDVGNQCDEVGGSGRYALDVAWRLSVQWPDIDLDPVELSTTVRRVVDRVRRSARWDTARFHRELLRELDARGVHIGAGFYDLPVEHPPSGAPSDYLLEEPPFVLAHPWRCADDAMVRTAPLIVKTPSNAYRFDFLRALFPNARLRVLHLTRNPAASINGLIDGWLHHGFHSHRMAVPLDIPDYAARRPQDRYWWKFDLPPGWYRHTGEPLAKVCAFQWRSCHESILAELDRGRTDSIRVRFEDLTSADEARVEQFERISEWLGIPLDGALRHGAMTGIRPVVATKSPRPMRWLERADEVRSAMGGGVRDTAERLGYASEDTWI